MKTKKLLGIGMITVVALICVAAILFVGEIWRELNLFPFDKIPLTPTTIAADTFYFKDRSGNFYYGYVQELGRVYEPLQVDKASFVAINGQYAKDKDHVFYGKDIIENADLSTFSAVTRSIDFYVHPNSAIERVPLKGILNGFLYSKLNSGDTWNDQKADEKFAMDKNALYNGGGKIVDNTFAKVQAVGPDLLAADNKLIVASHDSLNSGTYTFPAKIDTHTFIPYTPEFVLVNSHLYCLNQSLENGHVELKNINIAAFKNYENKQAEPLTGLPLIFGDGKTFYQNDTCAQTTL